MSQKIDFYYNFDMFKKHINFPSSKECPQRMDILDLAMKKANKLNIITPELIDEQSLENILYKDAILNIHSEKHLIDVESSPKITTALYPIKTFISTLHNSVKDGQISFYAMRPPGHHSYNGGARNDDKIDNADFVGQGFCYFNNVAFASMYLAKNFSKKSILIVDWDYHHGNGTQEAFFNSTNNEIKAKYPEYEIYFLSTHNANIYPYNEIEGNTPNNFGTINGKATNSNSYIRNIHIGKNDYKEDVYLPKFRDAIDETFTKMKPDVIFISAGFDARKDDPVARFTAGQGLDDETYFKMAQYIKQKQQLNCPKTPIISLQEGGYNITDDGFSNAVVEHLKGLYE